MTSTAHTLVAGAIASRVGNPFLASALALLSHFVLDSIPHWDLGTNWRKRPKWVTGTTAILETLLGITVAYFVFRQKVPTIPLLSAIIVSVLPDWLEAPWYIFFVTPDKTTPSPTAGCIERLAYGIYRMENRFHRKVQAPLGIATQIIAVAFFLLILS